MPIYFVILNVKLIALLPLLEYYIETDEGTSTGREDTRFSKIFFESESIRIAVIPYSIGSTSAGATHNMWWAIALYGTWRLSFTLSLRWREPNQELSPEGRSSTSLARHIVWVSKIFLKKFIFASRFAILTNRFSRDLSSWPRNTGCFKFIRDT